MVSFNNWNETISNGQIYTTTPLSTNEYTFLIIVISIGIMCLVTAIYAYLLIRKENKKRQ